MLYRVWQPWLQGYHGELNMGYDNTFQYYEYIGVDSSPKE